MKKIIISVVLVCALFLIPFQIKGQEVNTIEPVQTEVQIQIELLKQLLALYQQLLQMLLANQQISATSTIVETPVTQETVVQDTAVVETSMPEETPFEFTVQTYNNQVSLTVVIPEQFDSATLIVKDTKNNKVWRNSSKWFKDKDNFNRQVIDVQKGLEYTYEVTASKVGFQDSTKTGNF